MKEEEAILGVAPAKSTGAFFNKFRKTSSKRNYDSHSGKLVAGRKRELTGAKENEVYLMSSNLRNSS